MFPITLFGDLTTLRFADAFLSGTEAKVVHVCHKGDGKPLDMFFSPRRRRFTRDVITFLQ